MIRDYLSVKSPNYYWSPTSRHNVLLISDDIFRQIADIQKIKNFLQDFSISVQEGQTNFLIYSTINNNKHTNVNSLTNLTPMYNL